MAEQSLPASASPTATVVRREWRAPTADRTALTVPAWSELPQVIEQNTRWFDEHPVSVEDWHRWRNSARGEILQAAIDYTGGLTGETPVITTGPLIVDGHQPELFHPGVWAKNFAIHRLAERCGGQSLHLIVDNDVLSRTAVAVPVGAAADPQITLEAFDHLSSSRPWEAAQVRDGETFRRFAEQVARRMQVWGIEPLVLEAWPLAVSALDRTSSLADCLTAARVAIERRWGIRNLELPVSRLSGTAAFHRFAACMLRRAAEVRRHYNEVVQEYRRVNRVRNRAHPVPDLVSDGEWCEAPFRLWRDGDTRRQRAFVRQHQNGGELRNEQDVVAEWRGPIDALQTAIAALPDRGLRLRPRALTLTLFARMLLADLFVHGLGGAKYDEMTDALAARLFGAPPSPYLTVTATVRLPLKSTTREPVLSPAAIRQQLWVLQHNPQRFADRSIPQTAALIDEKQQLIATPPGRTRSERRRRYLRLREINAALATTLGGLRDELMLQLQRSEQQQHAGRVFSSREFSWVLFPEETLRTFYEAAFPVG